MKCPICKYCGRECEKVSDKFQEDILPRWYQCSNMCNVAYLALGNFIKIISLHTDLNNRTYGIDLNYDKNQTIIYCFPGIFLPSELVTTIPGIIENLTPQNIKEKIKVYLTFI